MTTTTTLNNLIRMFLRSPAQIRQFLPSKSFCAQIISAGVLASAGDMICQKMVEKREQLDIRRTSRFALTTMLIIVPVQFRWFRFLEHRFPIVSNQPYERVKTALKRVALDQSCLAPLLTAAFLFSVNLMESFSTQTALNRVKPIYLEVMVNSYKFWPFVQIVNMTVVPLHLRVVFLQFFAIFWNIYISHKANN